MNQTGRHNGRGRGRGRNVSNPQVNRNQESAADPLIQKLNSPGRGWVNHITGNGNIQVGANQPEASQSNSTHREYLHPGMTVEELEQQPTTQAAPAPSTQTGPTSHPPGIPIPSHPAPLPPAFSAQSTTQQPGSGTLSNQAQLTPDQPELTKSLAADRSPNPADLTPEHQPDFPSHGQLQGTGQTGGTNTKPDMVMQDPGSNRPGQDQQRCPGSYPRQDTDKQGSVDHDLQTKASSVTRSQLHADAPEFAPQGSQQYQPEYNDGDNQGPDQSPYRQSNRGHSPQKQGGRGGFGKPPRDLYNKNQQYSSPQHQYESEDNNYNNQDPNNRPYGQGGRGYSPQKHGDRRGFGTPQRGNTRNHQGYSDGSQSSSSGRGGFSSSGSSSSSPGNRLQESDPEKFLSKTLSYILRHGAVRQGFKMMPGGFLYVKDILEQTTKLRDYNVAQVKGVVDSNDKQRFALKMDETGNLMIRANQGHTIEVDDLDLTPITRAEEVDKVVHGTYYPSWNTIKTKGLSRMKRNHIHFAVGEPGQNEVISGMRSTCEVMIYIDLKKALKDGLKFFRSANNVILSPGDGQGIIYPCYFDNVVNRYPLQQIPFDNTICSSTMSADQIANELESGKKGRRKEKKKARKQEVGNQPDMRQARKKRVTEDGPIEVDMELSGVFKEEQGREVPAQWDQSEGDLDTSTEISDAVSSTGSQPHGGESAGREQTRTGPQTGTQAQGAGAADREPVSNTGNQAQGGEGTSREPVSLESSDSDVVVEEEWKELTVMTEEDCRKIVDDMMVAKPECVAVCCCGQDLGSKDGIIQLIVVATMELVLIFPVSGEQKVVGQGLDKLLMDTSIHKVFNDIGNQAVALLHQYNIILTEAPLWDTKILWDELKDRLSADDRKTLEGLNFDPDMWLRADTEGKFANYSQELSQSIVHRARNMLKGFSVFKDARYKTQVREVKKDIYKAVKFFDEEHFLCERFQELMSEEENKKEKKKKKSVPTEQPSAHSKDKKKKKKK